MTLDRIVALKQLLFNMDSPGSDLCHHDRRHACPDLELACNKLGLHPGSIGIDSSVISRMIAKVS